MNELKKMYQSETRLFHLFQILAGIAILISCLGLLGLISFMTEQRNKEIGIRKVLGASVLGIVALLSRDFFKMVLVALLIASPLAYYFMNQWLDNFAYRTGIPWWVFLIAGLGAISLAFLTIGFQSIKAAIQNPVDAIRNE